ncbi:MAG: acylphosphatase [Rhodocyclaceae bacterium]
MAARRLILRGRVQGVGFRVSLAREAERLGVSGWVRNRSDGSVEAVVAGEGPALDRIVEWARHGPPGARVAGVEISAEDGEYSGFELRASL